MYINPIRNAEAVGVGHDDLGFSEELLEALIIGQRAMARLKKREK